MKLSEEIMLIRRSLKALDEQLKILQERIKKKELDDFGVFKGAKPFEEEKETHKEFW